MEKLTKIPVEFFSLHLFDTQQLFDAGVFCEDYYKNNYTSKLVDTYKFDLPSFFERITNTTTSKHSKIIKWMTLLLIVRNRPDEIKSFLELTSQMTGFFESDLRLDEGAISIVLDMIYEHIDEFVPHEVLRGLCNSPAALIKVMMKKSLIRPIERSRKILCSVLEILKDSTQEAIVRVDIQPKYNLKKHIELYANEPFYKELFDMYCDYNPETALISMESDRYNTAVMAGIPIITPTGLNYNYENMTDQFESLGYFICPYKTPPMVSNEMAQATQDTHSKLIATHSSNIGANQNLVLNFRNPGFEFLGENIWLEISSEKISKGLTIRIRHLKTTYKVLGFFNDTGLIAYLKAFSRSIDELELFGHHTDEVLCYGRSTNPQCEISPLNIFFDEYSLKGMLPVWFDINYKDNCIKMCGYHPEKLTLIDPLSNSFESCSFVIFDLKNHMERALRSYRHSFAKALARINEKSQIFKGLPDVIYVQQRFPSRSAHTMFKNLEMIIRKNRDHLVVLGDPYTNRYFAGWMNRNPMQMVHMIILSENEKEMSDELAILRQLCKSSNSYALNFEQFNKYVKKDKPKLLHDASAEVCYSEIIDRCGTFAKQGLLDALAAERHVTSEGILVGIGILVTNILREYGFKKTSWETHKILKILFTHSYNSYKEKNPEQLLDFMKDIASHYGYCSQKLQEVLWQHYYTNFEEAIPKTVKTHFEHAITAGMESLIKRLSHGAADAEAKIQTIHMDNFLRKHLSKNIKIPNNPHTLQDAKKIVDPHANNKRVGNDYLSNELTYLARSMMLSTMVIELINHWKHISNSQTENYLDLFKEFVNLNRALPLPLAEQDQMRAELIELKNKLVKKQQELEGLKLNRIWSIYESTLALKAKEKMFCMRKRERISVHHQNLKRSRTQSMNSAGTSLLASELLSQAHLPSSGDKIVMKLSAIEESIKEMESDTLILDVLKLEDEIKDYKERIQAKINQIQRVDDLFERELELRHELTPRDEISYVQKLTVSGALNWLSIQGTLNTISEDDGQNKIEVATW
jgi:hypothetical protein